MAEVQISFMSLKEVRGGAFLREVDQAIAAVVRDCFSRPGDPAKRKVKIELEFKPLAVRNEAGIVELDGVQVVCSGSAATPKFAAAPVHCRPVFSDEGRRRALVFQTDAPDNARQKSLLEKEGEA